MNTPRVSQSQAPSIDEQCTLSSAIVVEKYFIRRMLVRVVLAAGIGGCACTLPQGPLEKIPLGMKLHMYGAMTGLAFAVGYDRRRAVDAERNLENMAMAGSLNEAVRYRIQKNPEDQDILKKIAGRYGANFED